MKRGFLTKKSEPAAMPPTTDAPKKDKEAALALLQKEYEAEKFNAHARAYKQQMSHTPVPPVIQLHIDNFQRPFPHVAFLHKAFNISQFKYDFALTKTKTITITIRAVSPNAIALIGFIHGDCAGKDFTPRFVSIGGSMESSQGEVRKNVIAWDQFCKVWEHFSNICEPVEKFTLKRMDSRKLAFHADFYRPHGCTVEQDKLDEFVNNSRCAIKFFAMSWLFDYKNIKDKVFEKKMQPEYMKLIGEGDHIALWETLNPIEYHRFMRMCSETRSNFSVKDDNWYTIGAVQKIRTLSIAEVARPNDINMDLWREIYLQQRCSQFSINFVSPSFPVIGNWFFIKNAHAQLFDSPAIREKYAQSDIANKIAEQLHRADEYNASATGPAADLVARVHDAIAQADREVRLTDLAVCILSEWAGRSVGNAYTVSNIPTANSNIIRMFNDPIYFTKHLFELLHGLSTMHRSGIAHGALDPYKVFVQHQLKTYDHPTKRELFKNPLCVFESGHTYVFPEDGSVWMIVGMANALLEENPRLVTDHGGNFVERYISDQLPRVIAQLKPMMGEHFNEATITQIYITDPSKCFRMIAAADVYHFFNQFLIIVTESPRGLPAESIALCEQIRARALALFITPLHDHASTLIIDELFASYRIGPEYQIPPDQTLFNVYRRDNPLTWDVSEYESWGPLVSREEEYNLYKKITKTTKPEMEQWERMRKLDETARLRYLAQPYIESERGILEPIPF